LGVHSSIDWAVEQGAPVGPQVYQTLRALIIRADLAPGAWVSETELAKAFATSRQPVREAFIKLADDGLVEIRPQRGTLVRKINIASMMDTRFVREAVEADIVRIAAQRTSPGAVADLREQIARQRATMDQNPDAFMRLDDQFHRTLATIADKSDVSRVVDNVKAQMDRVRFLTLSNRSVIRISIDQHEKIVDAIEGNSSEQADAAMREHLRQILIDLPYVAQLKPEFFDNTSSTSANEVQGE
jgi:DNA-binding GntR family transcriptional regulator